MRLTLQTDYAMRIMMALAEGGDGVKSVQDLAAQFAVSKNHLMKTAQVLAAGGFVRTVRGRNGGLVLARPAGDIAISDIVHLVEPDMHIAECFHSRTCSFLPRCRLKGLLADARSAFMDTLAGKTLADVVHVPMALEN